jgi:cell division protein FtsL
MNRVNAALLVALLSSSLYLVHLAYESRRLFTAVDRAQAEQRRLDHEYERLLAERQSESTPLRVERLAREKLAMRSASPSVTQFVALPDIAPIAAGGSR